MRILLLAFTLNKLLLAEVLSTAEFRALQGNPIVGIPSGQRTVYSKGCHERGWLLSVDIVLASSERLPRTYQGIWIALH